MITYIRNVIVQGLPMKVYLAHTREEVLDVYETKPDGIWISYFDFIQTGSGIELVLTPNHPSIFASNWAGEVVELTSDIIGQIVKFGIPLDEDAFGPAVPKHHVEYLVDQKLGTVRLLVDGRVVKNPGYYREGAHLSATVTPKKGYKFLNWEDGSTLNPRSDTMGTEDIQHTAFTEAIAYTLNATSEHATITALVDGSVVALPAQVNYGSTVVLSAQPDASYQFFQWSDGVKDNPRTFIMTDNVDLTALMYEDFKINAVAPHASVICTVDGLVKSLPTTAPSGSKVSLKVVPDTGYNFIKWSNGITANPYNFTLTSDVDLTAEVSETFILNVDSLYCKVSALINGVTYTSFPVAVPSGSSVRLTAFSFDDGFDFGDWGVSKDNPYTFIMDDDVNLHCRCRELFDAVRLSGEAPLTASIIRTGTKFTGTYLYRLANEEEWHPYTLGTVITSDDPILFRGTYSGSKSADTYDRVRTNATEVSGDVSTLLNKVGGVADLTDYPYAFFRLFDGAPITQAPNLPSTTLSESCYHLMFAGTNLVVAPSLPATTLADYCYASMFEGTPLTEAPELPATTAKDHCYDSMFASTDLVQAPSLPALTLAESCYNGMFSGCTSLTSALPLPANTLAPNCYQEMFLGCTSLSTAPDLSATTLAPHCCESMYQESGVESTGNLNATNLAPYCYANMFEGCKNLTKPSALPATALSEYCYYSMFLDSGLSAPPSLPATKLATSCYESMFANCDLDAVPSLPAEVLADSCYKQMFQNNTKIIQAPDLPATILAPNCYESMFAGCSYLGKVSDLPAEKVPDGSYNYMFQNCPYLMGTITVKADYNDSAFEGMFQNAGTNKGAGGIIFTPNFNNTDVENFATLASVPPKTDINGWSIVNQISGLCFTNIGNLTATLSFTTYVEQPVYDLEVTTNGSDWVPFTSPVSFEPGTSVFVRGTYNPSLGGAGNKFTISGSQVGLSGDISSILTPEGGLTDISAYPQAFRGLFMGNDLLTIVDSNILPFTTLSEACYENLFYGCGITQAPHLPATTLTASCYAYMFMSCASLISTPDLPATTLAPHCYESMFMSCRDLSNAPKELPATTLADACYQHMFQDCTSLAYAPYLPATTLDSSCYAYMYQNCTNLQGIIHLPFYEYTRSMVESMFSNAGTNKGSGGTINIPNLYKYDFISFASVSVPHTDNGGWDVIGIKYTLDVTATNGTVVAEVEGEVVSLPALVSPDDKVQLTFTPEEGFKFTGWKIDGALVSKDNPYTFIMPLADQNFTADATDSVPYLCFTNIGSGSNSIGIRASMSSAASGYSTYQYSLDGVNWTDYTVSTSPELISFADCIYFRGQLQRSKTAQYYHYFTITNPVNVSGDLSTIVSMEPSTSAPTYSYAFRRLFYNCKIVDATELFSPYDVISSIGALYGLFENCNSLERINPDFFGGLYRLQSSTCARMFYGCSSLTQAPKTNFGIFEGTGNLQAMFYGCSSLTQAPSLPATALTNNCYYQMFYGCTSITATPNLPATTLGEACYQSMFQGCTSLEKVSSLPATTLAVSCYRDMFNGCTKLVQAPSLPATTLVAACYYQMFYGCTALAGSYTYEFSDISFTNCVASMYYLTGTTAGAGGVINLPNLKATDFITAAQVQVPHTESDGGWDVEGIKYALNVTATNGSVVAKVNGSVVALPAQVNGGASVELTFTPDEGLTFAGWKIDDVLVSMSNPYTFTMESDMLFTASASEVLNECVSFIAASGPVVHVRGSMTLSAGGAGVWSISGSVSFGEYSIDNGNTWYKISGTYTDSYTSRVSETSHTFEVHGLLPSGPGWKAGDKVMLRGKTTSTVTTATGPGTVSSKSITIWIYETSMTSIQGNITSRLSDEGTVITDLSGLTSSDIHGCKFWSGDSGIVDASGLFMDYTNIPSSAFTSFFSDNTALVTPPSLPATTIAASCYSQMFNGCTSLITAPDLPATTLASSCYSKMFYECTALVNAPDLPATTLASSCYDSMFYRCLSLTKAPNISATVFGTSTTNGSLHYMFMNCTSLPDLIVLNLTPQSGSTVQYAVASMFAGAKPKSGKGYIQVQSSQVSSFASWSSATAANGWTIESI